MDRRTFLQTSAAVTGGNMLAQGCTGTRKTVVPGSMERIGVQLYTVRDRMAESVSATLGQVAEIGYDEVEFAGYFGNTPEEIRGLLDDYSLDAPAAHIGLDEIRREGDAVLDLAQAIGHHYLVVAFLGEADRATLDDYRRVADEFNAFGLRCHDAGLQFAYHNHAFEFERIDGEVGYDVLLDNTDPELVKMEIDLFWIRAGDQDPLPYFGRYPGRFALCHVKDMNAAAEMVDVGAGVINFAEIFARAELAGLKHYFVEHDTPGDSLRSIETSYRHLARLTY